MRRFLLDTGTAGDFIAFSLGNCSVVAADSDLAAMPDLPVENWAA
jgi:hypothetical protein